LDRAIDIKRRAQRCIQAGDLPGALAEYEKLLAADSTDPYTYVLLADLLYKMGEHPKAGERYLTAASCYEQAGLYKNAIAVGKKMLRLALSPGTVLERLAALHALDGLPAEASLYYTQYAEHLVRESKVKEAAAALRKGFECSPENVKALERLAEVQSLSDDDASCAQTLAEAAMYYARAGQSREAERCRARAEHLRPGAVAAFEAQAPPPPAPADAAGSWVVASGESIAVTPEPGMVTSFEIVDNAQGPPRLAETTAYASGIETDRAPRFVPPAEDSVNGMEVDRHDSARASAPPADVEAAGPPMLETPASADAGDLDSVERMLGVAQTEFRAGHHAEAAGILARAAQAYEGLGRLDEAASIHRSLCKSPHVTSEMLERWLANCEQRGERGEAAEVACELGDHAIHHNDLARAREWFERAAALDPANAVAARRLERLRPEKPAPAVEPVRVEPPVAAPMAPVAEVPPAESADGRVEVAVDRGQAVTFDFASMLAEFQRGVETQLSGDAQAHYDLAMAYREMGLHDQAIESFQLARKDINFRHRCAEMIGRCYLESGHFEEAAFEFQQALAFASSEPEIAIGMRFQLGIALEAAGRTHEALAEFERVFEAQANYPDVAIKIRDLRKNLEAA
jgi:tetratricopeptide (TPR) repeat protein